MPPVRTHRNQHNTAPNPLTVVPQTRHRMTLVGTEIPFQIPSYNRLYRTNVNDIRHAEESQSFRNSLRDIEAQLELHDPDLREIVLDRLGEQPDIRDELQTYWDMRDEAALLRDQAHVLYDLYRQASDRRGLFALHNANRVARFMRMGWRDTITNAMNGLGTEIDPIDVDVYETASEDDDNNKSTSDAADRSENPPRPRHPINSSGSEADNQGQVYHRDGRACRSMWPHGPDYETDSGVEEPVREQLQQEVQTAEITRERQIWRQTRGEDGTTSSSSE